MAGQGYRYQNHSWSSDEKQFLKLAGEQFVVLAARACGFKIPGVWVLGLGVGDISYSYKDRLNIEAMIRGWRLNEDVAEPTRRTRQQWNFNPAIKSRYR